MCDQSRRPCCLWLRKICGNEPGSELENATCVNYCTYVCIVHMYLAESVMQFIKHATGPRATRVATWPYIKFACTQLNMEKRVNYEINFKII